MTQNQHNLLKKRKEELEAELEGIQKELDDSFDEVKTEVGSQLEPSAIIKRHPLPILGLSIAVGFLAGKGKGGFSLAEEGFALMLWAEFKKLATRKAISMASDYTEKILDDVIE